MKSSEFKILVKAVIKESLNQADNRDMDDARIIAHTIYQPVHLTRFVKEEPNGDKIYAVYLHSANGPVHVIKQDKSKKWFYAVGQPGETPRWKSADEYLKEESSTGAVAGYSTPFAFTKNKKGSPKGIAAAEKYGKVVGESPRI